MELNELAKEAHQNARDKGFFDGPENIPRMIALIHSEVSEALEADRENRYVHTTELQKEYFTKYAKNEKFNYEYDVMIKHSFEEEMADIIIRTLDLCAFKGIDIDFHVKAKMRYNKNAPKNRYKKY